jgi:geranylgeranyl pyrophosphate synthase
VEVVHAYSLIHDDLPCMDDDDVRRGRPTVHRVYGVPAATAAGLAMVPLAARCALDAARALALPDATGGAIVGELMRAAGGGGMIGGQLLDLEGEGLALSLAELEQIHRAKTGALIRAALRIGGIAASASDAAMAAFDRYGSAVGLAFQIADDVLDVTATTDQLGKTAGRDVELHKSTYPALLGVAGAVERAEALVEDACRALGEVQLLTPPLDHLARFVVARRS